MSRIPFPTPDQMDDAQRRVYDKVVSGRRGKMVGPLRAAMHSPELADRWQALGEFLRYNTSLTPQLSELAILVTGRACQSPFEWYAHRIEAEKVGIPSAVIAALLSQQMPDGLDEPAAAVVRFAQELNQYNSVSDAVYARALTLLGTRAVVELTALVGYYTMVAMTLNTHEIPLPEGEVAAFSRPQEGMA